MVVIVDQLVELALGYAFSYDDVSAQSLADRIRDGRIDVQQIDMPSFNQFNARLAEGVNDIVGVTR